MNPARRRAIFRRLQAANPTPTTELLHQTPFELLVAVIAVGPYDGQKRQRRDPQTLPRCQHPGRDCKTRRRRR